MPVRGPSGTTRTLRLSDYAWGGALSPPLEVMLMKVRMLTSMVAANWSYAPGDIVDVEPRVAKAWIEAGLATPVKGGPEPEAAMLEPPERAVLPAAKRRKR